MQRLWQILAPHRFKLAAAAAVLAIAAIIWGGRTKEQPSNPLLETPVLALESLHANALYFNAVARPWLFKLRPDLLTETDRSDTSERTQAFAKAVLNPKLFRQLYQEYRFDALLLAGDPSQYEPLLEHLVETKDWKVTYVDPTSFVFRRNPERPWQLSDLDPLRARFASASEHDRGVFLALTGSKLVAARMLEPGKALLDEAMRLDEHLPEVWNGMTQYHMAKKDWSEAFAASDKALSLSPDFLPAIATKTQLLYGAKHYPEAFDLSRKLIAKIPDDPNLLFYHAKIAHEAHAYKDEIDALQRLIARAEAEKQPLSGYEIYLGQAYAKIGQGQRAIDQFMLALDDPDLSDEQRSFARESIVKIKKKTGL